MLVLAGPGTGKTTTLVEAVAARVERGTRPERVLVLTFSRKAAQELRARIAARLGVATAEPLAWTFHAFAMRVLGEASALDPEVVPPPVLLSGPEQDVVLRELVAGAHEDGRGAWPPDLGPALPTRGFADELRRLLARTSALGLSPVGLARIAESTGRGDWAAAAGFYAEYLDVTEARGVVDYAELVGRAVAFAAGPAGAELRERYDLVLVDEYQDTDPMQEALLRAVAGGGRDLVVVGDPDQSIYAFRGAEVRNILEFPTRFPDRSGAPAPVHALRVCRRSGSTLLAATRAVARPLPVVGVGGETARAHRDLTPDPATPGGDGQVEVRTYPNEAAEAAAVADLLRREHLEHGTPWDAMAVVVRSTSRSGPRLRRALTAAGVPVEVANDELPLAGHPAVVPLLTALASAADLAREHPHGALTPAVAHALLVSPLGGFDSVALRRLGRALRADDDPGSTRSSAELTRDALLDDRLLIALPDHLAVPVRRLGALLRTAAERIAAGASTHEALWAVWSATPWPQRLERAARRGGADGRRADHDLDAVLALFDAAQRHDEQSPGRGVTNFVDVLAAQQVPGDTLAERAARPGGVRLLTAHRSKGLEWDVVVVPGVQEDHWPDVRRRGSLLAAERLGADDLAPTVPTSMLLAEERRLFYVAATRARRRLVVTAVASALEDGLRPSRLVDDLGVELCHVDRPPVRPLVLSALVAELRRVAEDPDTEAALRQAAIDRLARLASAAVGERALVPSAHPDRWWGVRDLSVNDVPFVADGEPVPLSGSAIGGLVTCPARWMLARQVRAEGARGPAMSLGSVVHALADGVSTGAIPAELDALVDRLDAVWGAVVFDAPWQSRIERDSVVEALGRFLRWESGNASSGRGVLASEAGFEVELDADGLRVRLRGRLDRVDLDPDGRVVVVDFKTGRSSPGGAEVAVDPQLGAYQRAVEAGGFDDLLPERPVRLGGAELVQLRQGTASGAPKVQVQPPLRDPAAGRAALGPEATASDAASDAVGAVGVVDGVGADGDGVGEVVDGVGADGADWFDHLLSAAARRVVLEQLPATPHAGCETCPFTSSCPADDAGQQVLR